MFVVIVAVLTFWAFIVFYPWPQVPYEKPRGAAPQASAQPETSSVHLLTLSLEISEDKVASLTFFNETKHDITLHDNSLNSSFTLLRTDAKGKQTRQRLGVQRPAKPAAAQICLVPGASYSRKIKLGMLPPNPGAPIEIAISYQPGDIAEAYAAPKELVSNTVTWPLETEDNADDLMEAIQ